MREPRAGGHDEVPVFGLEDLGGGGKGVGATAAERVLPEDVEHVVTQLLDNRGCWRIAVADERDEDGI